MMLIPKNLVGVEVGNVISFKYKGGRGVQIRVTYINETIVIGNLTTDYIGKNEEWFKGEEKQFNRSEMKQKSKPH